MNPKDYGIGEREISFRAWDGNQMILEKDFNVHTIVKEQIYDKEEVYPIMQFTGLLDKNSFEIYEGDVVRHTAEPDNNFVVYWEPDASRWRIRFCNISYDKSWREFTKHVFSMKFEVIGNVFENPDLCSK